MFVFSHRHYLSFFFFNDPATTEIYTLSLHDALPIWSSRGGMRGQRMKPMRASAVANASVLRHKGQSSLHFRSEEHTSELQSRRDLVCRLLLEKKKTTQLCTGNERR